MLIDVVITDDHPLAINGIRTMLDPCSHIAVTDTYNSGASLLEGLKRHTPDVLLLDILLPDVSGKDLAPVILKTYPGIRIVTLTSLDAPAIIKLMLKRGCLGYLLKDTDDKTLIAAIEHAYKGEEFIEPSLKEHLLQDMLKHKKASTAVLPRLTRREKEILELIVKGYTAHQIADMLFLSYRTIENHKYSILQKFDVKNSAGLVHMAMLLGIAQ